MANLRKKDSAYFILCARLGFRGNHLRSSHTEILGSFQKLKAVHQPPPVGEISALLAVKLLFFIGAEHVNGIVDFRYS